MFKFFNSLFGTITNEDGRGETASLSHCARGPAAYKTNEIDFITAKDPVNPVESTAQPIKFK